MNVRVPLASFQIVHLGIGQGHCALGRTWRILPDRYRHAGVLAGCRRAVEVGGRRWTGKCFVSVFSVACTSPLPVELVGGTSDLLFMVA